MVTRTRELMTASWVGIHRPFARAEEKGEEPISEFPFVPIFAINNPVLFVLVNIWPCIYRYRTFPFIKRRVNPAVTLHFTVNIGGREGGRKGGREGGGGRGKEGGRWRERGRGREGGWGWGRGGQGEGRGERERGERVGQANPDRRTEKERNRFTGRERENKRESRAGGQTDRRTEKERERGLVLTQHLITWKRSGRSTRHSRRVIKPTGESDRRTGRQMEREKERQILVQAEKGRKRERVGQADRQTERPDERERQIFRQRYTLLFILIFFYYSFFVYCSYVHTVHLQAGLLLGNHALVAFFIQGGLFLDCQILVLLNLRI
jgi:hypothetical protein